MPEIFIQNRQTKVVYLLLGGLLLTLIALCSAVIATARSDSSQPELYFLSVGQGDSSLIELPGGVQILIDGGPDGRGLLDNLARLLPPQDRYIDLVIMSHPQLDHFGGFIDLFKNYRIGAFISNQRAGSIAAYQELRSVITKQQIPDIQLLAGDSIMIGQTQLLVLGPLAGDLTSDELNDGCVVVLLRDPAISALYTGDIGQNVEDEFISRYDLHADVLKVGHHGSRFSSSAAFLQAVRPAVAVIEVGKNTYGHPTQQAIERLTTAGAQIFRTDQQGIIKIIAQDDGLAVFSGQE